MNDRVHGVSFFAVIARPPPAAAAQSEMVDNGAVSFGVTLLAFGVSWLLPLRGCDGNSYLGLYMMLVALVLVFVVVLVLVLVFVPCSCYSSCPCSFSCSC